MGDGLTPAELDEFLNRTGPALVGVVATVRGDGSPHAVPVWYRWDGEAIQIWSGEERSWVKNVRRDPRVAFSVQKLDFPNTAAVFHGTALVTTGDTDWVRREIRRITERYVLPGGVDAYIAKWRHIHTIVTISPDSINAWLDTE